MTTAVNNFRAQTVSVSEGGGKPIVTGNNFSNFAVLETVNSEVGDRPLQSNRSLRCP